MDKLRIALIVSVILNLFLASALVAGIISVRSGGRMIAAGSLRIVGAELPAAERRPFRKALRQTRRAMRPTIIVSRREKMAAATLLRQPTIDQAAIIAALDRASKADLAVRAAVERRAVAYAATLPQADRAKLADAMQRRASRGRPVND